MKCSFNGTKMVATKLEPLFLRVFMWEGWIDELNSKDQIRTYAIMKSEVIIAFIYMI